MNNLSVLLIGSYLMSLIVLSLYEYIKYINRPQLIKEGTLVYLTESGTVRPATRLDSRVLGVALENGEIQSDGYYSVKVRIQ